MLDQVEVTVAEAAAAAAAGGRIRPAPCSRSCTSSAGDPGNHSRSPGCAVTGPAAPPSTLLPGAGDGLLRLGPLIRPLIEVHWTRMVAEINGVAQRRAGPAPSPVRVRPDPCRPRPLRDGIAALQDGRCFYCHHPPAKTPEADHFIPRIRCGIDAVENLVLADRRCNNDKRDLLPAPAHVTAWARRNHHHDTALAGLATACPVGHRPGRDHSRGPLDL